MELEESKKRGPVPVTEFRRRFYGATCLFDAIGKKLVVKADLKKCFPESYQKILSVAYYLILEDKNPLSYTLQELLDELDIIELFEHPGKQGQWGEMTKKQLELYRLLGVESPT